MDACRAVALFGVLVAYMDDMPGKINVLISIVKMGLHKKAATTSGACAMVRAEGQLNRFMLPASHWAVW